MYFVILFFVVFVMWISVCVLGSTLEQAMPFGATQSIDKLDKYNNNVD